MQQFVQVLRGTIAVFRAFIARIQGLLVVYCVCQKITACRVIVELREYIIASSSTTVFQPPRRISTLIYLTYYRKSSKTLYRIKFLKIIPQINSPHLKTRLKIFDLQFWNTAVFNLIFIYL